MMTLERAEHGFTCTMTGKVTLAEMDKYAADAQRMLPTGGSFNLLVDQRECSVLADDVQAKMPDVMKFFVSRGQKRVAVVCNSAVTSMQMNRITASTPAVASRNLAVNGKDARWQIHAQEWMAKGLKPAGA